MATVTTNGTTSQTLYQGTRQGCPLFPSLYAIFIELLALAICQNNNINTAQSEHKISLNADSIFSTYKTLTHYWKKQLL